MSTLVAGIDEAGLGPLLGPLVIGWCLFEVPDEQRCPWQLLEELVAREPKRDATHLIVDDSKRVFTRNPRGRRRLESTVLAFLELAGARPGSARELLLGPLGPTAQALDAHPWNASLPTLPLWADEGRLELTAHSLRRVAEAAGARPLDLGQRSCHPGELNHVFANTDNKGAAVWSQLVPIMQRLLEAAHGRQLDLVIDRQGGRAKYGPQLARACPGWSVALIEETDGVSSYRLSGPGEAVVTFREKGDRESFCVALASCLAKYARELSMEAFNTWFEARRPGLKPTAGYTTDGRRWLEDASPVLTGIQRTLLIRDR